MAQTWKDLEAAHNEAKEYTFSFINKDAGRTITPMTKEAIEDWPPKKAEHALKAINGYVDDFKESQAFMGRLEKCLAEKCNLLEFHDREFPKEQRMKPVHERLVAWAKKLAPLSIRDALDRVQEAGEFLEDYITRLERTAEENISNAADDCLGESPEVASEPEPEPEPPSVKPAPKRARYVPSEPEPEGEQYVSKAPPSSGGGNGMLIGGIILGVGAAAVGGLYLSGAFAKKCRCDEGARYCARANGCCPNANTFYCDSTGECQSIEDGFNGVPCPGGRLKCDDGC